MADFTTYKLFDAVARLGSLRKAAEHVSITPSALNRRILAIEEDYGTQLFERTPLGLRLNTAGELVLMHIRRQFADVEKVRSQIADLSGARSGTIRIAGSHTVLPHYLPDKIKSYLRSFPGVDFKVDQTFRGEAEVMLKNYDVDLAVVLDPQNSPDILMHGTMVQRVSLIMDGAHPLASKASLSLADCTAFPVALPGENTILHSVLQRTCLATQVTLKPALRSSNLFFTLECLGGTEMVGFRLNRPSTNPRLPEGLIARELSHPQAQTLLKLIQLKGRTLSVAASRFVEHLSPDFDT